MTDEISAVQFGKLAATIEGLALTMSDVQEDVRAQRVTTSSIEQKAIQAQQTGTELKSMISGLDGASGLLGRLQALEAKTEQIAAEVTELKQAFAQTRTTVIKIALLLATSGAAGAAGAGKIISVFQ